MRGLIWSSLLAVALVPACAADGGDTQDSSGENDGLPDETDDSVIDTGSEHEPGQILSDPVRICDGTDELRLAALFGLGGNEGGVAGVASMNGSLFLYIDGRCRYWVTGVTGQALTGTLEPDEVDLLTSRLGVGAWSEFQGQEWWGDWADAPPLILWQPSGRVDCGQQCEGPNLPEPLSLMGAALEVEVERLRAGAQPLDGPMRVLGVVGTLSDDTTADLVWTYQPDFAEFCSPSAGGSAGPDPALIDDPESLAALRPAWRDAQQRGEYTLAISDEAGALCAAWARDVLPFEGPGPWDGVPLP